MASDLALQECVPCKGGIPPLGADDVLSLLSRLDGGWRAVNNHHLEKEYKFVNFRQALDFTIKVGELAESVNHHPDIYLAWGKVRLTIWTHKINGLSESDFVLAARIDQIYESNQSNAPLTS